jgi:hypothetical protein
VSKSKPEQAVLSTSHQLLAIASGLYGLSLLTAVCAAQRYSLTRIVIGAAVAVNCAAVAIRYYLAWPMLPMYLAPAALPPVLGFIVLFIGHHSDPTGRIRRFIVTMALVIAVTGIVFPKDFYLPFIKSQSVAAHLFFLFGIAGRACFLTSAAWALSNLLEPKLSGDQRATTTGNQSFRWAVWGFAFWTLSLFSGELWSYFGWGTPVVWDDPAITTAMATWFFYICMLHLHLTGTWNTRGRNRYAAAGALVVLILNCFTELGPFRWLT